MANPRLTCAVALTLLSTSGCATLLAGTSSDVKVMVSDPPGPATIEVRALDGQHRQQVVADFTTLKLPKQHDYVLVIHRDGYASHNQTLCRQISPWFWLNAWAAVPFVFGLSGLAGPSNWGPLTIGAWGLAAGAVTALVDVASGGMWTLATDQVVVNLHPAR